MAGIDEWFGFDAFLEVVVVRVEAADQAIKVQRSLPDLKEQGAACARSTISALAIDSAIDGRVVGLVLRAAAFELAGSDLQSLDTLAGLRRENGRGEMKAAMTTG